MRARRRGEGGAAAMEFVLITPLLIMLFFGIVQVGLAMWRTQVIEAAAREGARVASVGLGTSEVEDAVEAAATGFDPSELAVTADLCSGSPDDAIVTVDASGSRLDFDIPFVGSYTANFSSTATFRCE